MTVTQWAIEGVETKSGREVREIVRRHSRAEAVAEMASRGITITSIEEAAPPAPRPLSASEEPPGEREALERIARSPLITEPIWTIAQGVIVGSLLLALVVVLAAIALAIIIGGIGSAAGR